MWAGDGMGIGETADGIVERIGDKWTRTDEVMEVGMGQGDAR